MYPVFEELAKQLSGVDKLAFGKYDLSENDPISVEIKTFP